MIMVLGPHKKKTEAMAEAREAQAARKAEAKANPGESQNAAEIDELDAEDSLTRGRRAEAASPRRQPRLRPRRDPGSTRVTPRDANRYT